MQDRTNILQIVGLMFVFMVFVCSSFGQTANDFEKKYGDKKHYEIRPYSLISPVFDDNGNMCRALIEPNRNVKSTSEDPFPEEKTAFSRGDKERRFPIPVLNLIELKEIFDELVPAKSRKGKGKLVFYGTDGFLPVISMGLQFENVEINVGSFTTLDAANTTINTSGDQSENAPTNFFNPSFGSYLQAVIVWKDRTCIENQTDKK